MQSENQHMIQQYICYICNDTIVLNLYSVLLVLGLYSVLQRGLRPVVQRGLRPVVQRGLRPEGTPSRRPEGTPSRRLRYINTGLHQMVIVEPMKNQ